jgi:thiol-disulfide isomerase/thioredoxin
MKTKHLFVICLACFAVSLTVSACNKSSNTSSENVAENVDDTATTEAAEGPQYIDIALPAPDGHIVKVSDYVPKNKYTLIDFWASWCGPCRGEMPTVVKAYNDYHAKGLEVIGVSLDKEKDAWVNAIDKLGMKWPQMSDLMGWQSAGAAKYNIHSIPANVLVDQQGRIVAKDLRGGYLLKKMEELLP